MLLGIDFGTSFSQAATLDRLGQLTLLLNPGEYGIPSEFYYDRQNGVLVGQDALDAGQGMAAANLVSEVKMEILSGGTFLLDGRRFTSKEIVGEIFGAVVSKAERIARKRAVGDDIEGFVISIPAKFNMQERCLIANAAKECLAPKVLPVIGIIKEPVAAALAYYRTTLEDGKYVLVYDLGGGTCDVALVRSDSSAAGHYTVVDSDMIRLGGRNWDKEVERYIVERIENASGMEIQGNAWFEEKVRRAAIDIKHDLSDPMKAKSIARVELNGRIHSVPISRNVFDEITRHLLDRTFDCLHEVYERNASNSEIDEIVCVGGSSNMLQVEEGLRKRFPQCRIRLYEPEHAIVYGTAIYANMDQKGRLSDVASFSYGTDSNTHYGFPDNREIISNIIKRGAMLPAVCSKGFCTIRDGQECVVFDIYESENVDSNYDLSDKEKRLVGTVRLRLPPNTIKGHSLTCRLGLNREGFLEVEAYEMSGAKVEATFNVCVL